MKPKKEIRVLKIKRVAEMLQNILLPLPAGGRLPGIRDLMKKYSLSDRIQLITSWSHVRKDKDFRGIVYKNDFQKMGTLAAEYMKKLLNGERDQVPLLTPLSSEVMRFPV